MKELIELYKREIALFLGTLNIHIGDYQAHTVSNNSEADKKFIKEKFINMKSGNVNEEALNKALDELM
ncbi:MAG: hypothetical protein IJ995_03130 [Clostridia bacterium]|nr:hypothetical protein [Clostridia bacterium]